jgi:hypothetical protein
VALSKTMAATRLAAQVNGWSEFAGNNSFGYACAMARQPRLIVKLGVDGRPLSCCSAELLPTH